MSETNNTRSTLEIFGQNEGWVDHPDFQRKTLDLNRQWFQFWKPNYYTEKLQVKVVEGEAFYRWVCPERGIAHSDD